MGTISIFFFTKKQLSITDNELTMFIGHNTTLSQGITKADKSPTTCKQFYHCNFSIKLNSTVFLTYIRCSMNMISSLNEENYFLLITKE